MPIQIHKRISDLLWTLGLLCWIVLMHESYFFPLHSHSDLKFQVIGECLELLALAGIHFLMPAPVTRAQLSEFTALTFRSRFVIGGYMASLVFVVYWRDFFPNDLFSLEAGGMNLLYGAALAVLFVGISYADRPRLPKLGKEEGKSAV